MKPYVLFLIPITLFLFAATPRPETVLPSPLRPPEKSRLPSDIMTASACADQFSKAAAIDPKKMYDILERYGHTKKASTAQEMALASKNYAALYATVFCDLLAP